MSMHENQPGEEGGSVGFRQLDENYRRLRSFCHSAGIALFILTGVVFMFIYRQVSSIREQTAQIQEELVEFEGSGAPAAIDELRRELYKFSQADPDFRPIYIRYFGTNQPPPAAGTAIMPARTNEMR